MTTPQYVPKKPTIKTSIHVPSLPLSAVKRDAEDTNREVVWDVGRAPAVETHGAMNEFGQGVSFFFKDLSYEVPDKEILRGITGFIRPATFTAIIGASGAGKSSFIDILAGRKKVGKIRGTVQVEGLPPSKIFKKIGSYVLQDSLLWPTQTVREALEFYADLHVNKDKDGKREVVDKLLALLNLSAVADSLIGNAASRGVSGGEKKRLTIGISLICNPEVLILDEATSGLDSFGAYSIVKLLSDLHKKGITVICTIHQPTSEIFETFDDLMIMDKGQAVYLGRAKHCIKYFQSLGFKNPKYYNPVDYFMLTLGEASPGSMADHWKKSSQNKAIIRVVDKELNEATTEKTNTFWQNHFSLSTEVTDEDTDVYQAIPERYTAGYLAQTSALVRRHFTILYRETEASLALFVWTLFISLVLGTLYLRMDFDYTSVQDRYGVIYFCIVEQAWLGLAYLAKFMEERDLYLQEQAAGDYDILPYFISITILEFPILAILPAVASSVIYWLANLNPGATNFFTFYAALMLHQLVSLSLYRVIGAFSWTTAGSVFWAPNLMTVFILFGGLYINEASIPPWYEWFSYLSFFKYTTRILLVNEYEGETYSCNTNSTVCGGTNGTVTGEEILEGLALQDITIWWNFLVLLAFALTFKLITLLGLCLLKRRN